MKSMLLTAAVMVPSLALAQHWEDRNWRVKDQESIKRTFDVGAGSGAQKLLVDNVSGFIHVTGYAGKEIQVTANRRTGADSNEALAEARRDVKLDMSQQGNFARLYVDGPFRGNNGNMNYRGDKYYGYRVSFDFEIQVPYAVELVLSTVNDGDIQVKKTSGEFDISGLNGGIEMDEVSGFGRVHTLNGPLKVSFAKNPTKDSEFKTLNGKMDIYFQPGLNADLSFQTLNGGVYSDFDVTTRPMRALAGENLNGKFVYRNDGRQMNARTGAGGPELTFHGLNGPIRLHSKAL